MPLGATPGRQRRSWSSPSWQSRSPRRSYSTPFSLRNRATQGGGGDTGAAVPHACAPSEPAMLIAMILLADGGAGGGTGARGQIQEIARTFGVDWPHLIAQVISFSVVCILLQRFAYRPV